MQLARLRDMQDFVARKSPPFETQDEDDGFEFPMLPEPASPDALVAQYPRPIITTPRASQGQVDVDMGGFGSPIFMPQEEPTHKPSSSAREVAWTHATKSETVHPRRLNLEDTVVDEEPQKTAENDEEFVPYGRSILNDPPSHTRVRPAEKIGYRPSRVEWEPHAHPKTFDEVLKEWEDGWNGRPPLASGQYQISKTTYNDRKAVMREYYRLKDAKFRKVYADQLNTPKLLATAVRRREHERRLREEKY
jgi:hypothetical protein